MSHFVDAELYREALPSRYAPILKDIQSFVRSVHAAREDRSPAAVTIVREHHQQLLDDAAETLPPTDAIDADTAARAFADGVFRASYLRRTSCGNTPNLDTAGSQTLWQHRADIEDNDAIRDRLCAALQETFGLPSSFFVQRQEHIAPELQSIDARHAVMQRLVERWPLDDQETRDDQIHDMFNAFFPDQPFRPGEVQIVRTGTVIFFCLPISDGRLTTRPDGGDTAARGFIDWLFANRQRQFAHFPSFGPFRADTASATLQAAVRTIPGLTPTEAEEALTGMVTVLPTGEIDKYIVHDVWGHQWQALLYAFEDPYRDLASSTQLPELDRRPAGADWSPTLREAILDALTSLQSSGRASTVRFDTWLAAWSQDRLYRSLAGLTAEVLADMTEQKHLVLNPAAVDLMPSSSMVKEFPTKLDLTLLDLPMYFRMAVRGLRTLSRERVQERVVDGMCTGTIPADRETVARLVDVLGAHANEWLDQFTKDDMAGGCNEEGALPVTPFDRVCLSYVGLHAALNATCASLNRRELPSGLPISGFHDVLLCSLASFLEADWRTNFWHLDEFVAHFEDMWSAFLTTLSR